MSRTLCYDCSGTGKIDRSSTEEAVCYTCGGSGYRKEESPQYGRLIAAATLVMLKQRAKGIDKYGTDLEGQKGYSVGGMINMVAEELADGSVYVQKVREQYLALLDELEKAAFEPSHTYQRRLMDVVSIIKRERGNV